MPMPRLALLAAGLLLLVLVFRRRNTQPSPASGCAGRLQPTRPGGGPSLANQTPVSPAHSWRAHGFTRLSMLQHSKQQCARVAPLRLNRVPSQSRRLDSFQIRNSSKRFSSSGIFLLLLLLLLAAGKIGR